MLHPANPPQPATRPFYSSSPAVEAPVAPTDLAQEASPLRRIAFKMALVLVLIHFGCIQHLFYFLLHVNTYLLYLFGIPTLVGVALAGGIQRTLRGRPAIYWLCFVLVLIAGVPFSSWRGGSFQALVPYIRTVFPTLFVIAGLTYTWRECRSMMWAIAAGAVIIMAAADIFRDNTGYYGDRLAIQFGTILNSNDYACHLIYLIPFVIWAGMTARFKVIRLGAWGAVAFGVLLVLRTGSRGALVALVAGGLYWLIRGTMRQRVALLAAAPLAILGLLAFVPKSSLVRIVSFSASDQAPEEAIESAQMRRYLLQKSVEYTLDHPVFGVGMSQFSDFEGERNIYIGTHGAWREAHNSYTQLSSECGIPALLLYLAAIAATFRMVNRVYKRARGKPEYREIAITAFCVMMTMVMFCTAITFVNFAYFFYLPMLSSLAIALCMTAEAEMDKPPVVPVAPQYSFAPRRRPVPLPAR